MDLVFSLQLMSLLGMAIVEKRSCLAFIPYEVYHKKHSDCFIAVCICSGDNKLRNILWKTQFALFPAAICSQLTCN